MSDAYAAAGVDTHQADQGVAAIVAALMQIETGRERLALPLSGHYASVLRMPGALAPNLGIALATDSVGSKVIIAEQARRFDTIGIDCVAMNVNDLICVGAQPLALLDYVAVERAEPEQLAAIGRGLALGASQAGVEVPGGEVCQVPEVLRGHPSPYGFDLVGSAFGVVSLDRLIDGSAVAPGDVMIGLPASGVHSNGLTLARRALLDDGQLSLDQRPDLLSGQTVADALLEPTVIYVRAILALLASEIAVHGLAHITGGGLMNLRRIGSGVGYTISTPLPSPTIFELIATLGKVSAPEMWEVFNMGCGFVVMVAAEQAPAAVELLARFHPGSAVIGHITAQADVIDLPGMGIHAPAGSDRLTRY
ncbi:phosphoribosylformylglycinamidine cyclo-ligase [Conexibacter sp. S30A1]|uniref:phosphoribosylformylglycinamidine cyclo-ligase n=1 Tax=Conexibacter sp. S30A1 TaxID=2937800 RepID=UPI00200BE84D|nr:phosphoribosylformylglycinamidine cyclo-ligase [Conexibacter sp. S30A1]